MAVGNPFDGPYGAGRTEYERYLRTPELLGLQKPPDRRSHPDELLFQSVHQVEEIWMKLIVHELGEAVVSLDADLFAHARHSVDRACRVEILLEQQLKLFETMLPSAYLAIRAGLGAGSGLDSPGFNRMNEIAPAIWSSFSRAVDRQPVDLLTVYQDPGARPDILAVAEALVTLDGQMQRFKREHIMTVRRIIGIGTASLRGNPIEMLERSAQLTYFPILWAVRDRLFIDFKADPLG
ncbi:MAG TPA: tryptophan 2,3-dioxygenase family protein [Candidatus Acidoferrum sp.]|nr:tryptophan 2,3-dioxygenase family protein [Candidatus Acidoferrum sp.]